MSLSKDKQDFADYLKKVELEPDPKIGSEVWEDDPAARPEPAAKANSLKQRKKLLKKRKKR